MDISTVFPDPKLAQEIGVGLFVVFLMFSLGLELRPADLRAVFRRPALLIAGLFVNYLVVPLATYSAVRIANVEAALATGILLAAAAPGGPVGAVFVQKARGTLPFAVALMVSMNLINTVATPLLAWAMQLLPEGADTTGPVLGMMRTILMFQILPLAIAMGVRARNEPLAARLIKVLDTATKGVIGVAIVALLFTEGPRVLLVQPAALIAMAVSIAVAMAAGWSLGGVGGDGGDGTADGARGNRVALSLLSGFRSMSVVLLLIATWFDSPRAIIGALTYSAMMFVSTAIAAALHKRRLTPGPD